MEELRSMDEIDRSGPFCLYFYADWLIYDKKMRVSLGRIESKLPNVKFYAISVDLLSAAELKKLKVNSIPVVSVGFENKWYCSIEGVQLTSVYRSQINEAVKKIEKRQAAIAAAKSKTKRISKAKDKQPQQETGESNERYSEEAI
jgi:thiol-disulfide isomerase/thioredoxin